MVKGATLRSDNTLRLKKVFLKWKYDKIITTDRKTRFKKVQYYDINREAAKISALLSGKIDKYKYLIVKQFYPRINKDW